MTPLTILRLPSREPWMDKAVCLEVGGDVFFTDPNEHALQYAAKRMCRRCEVINDCLQYALRNDEDHGVWGGMTAPERHRIKRTGNPNR